MPTGAALFLLKNQTDMRQLGTAKKLFHELVHGDKLYYIDPKKPMEISELTVKGVEPHTKDKRFVVITYFKSDEATKVITLMTEKKTGLIGEDGREIKVKEIDDQVKEFNEHLIDSIPVGKIIVHKNASDCMTSTLPPSVYFTNKRALEKFMGK